ncbi:hypothetical protein JTE90_023694, partial [Oedothorax gibbosus]
SKLPPILERTPQEEKEISCQKDPQTPPPLNRCNKVKRAYPPPLPSAISDDVLIRDPPQESFLSYRISFSNSREIHHQMNEILLLNDTHSSLENIPFLGIVLPRFFPTNKDF